MSRGDAGDDGARGQVCRVFAGGIFLGPVGFLVYGLFVSTHRLVLASCYRKHAMFS